MSTRPPPDLATQPNAPRSVAQPSRLWLHFVYPKDLAGQLVELSKGLVLGRDPPDDRVDASGGDAADRPAAGPYASIAHPTVSRRHASVQHGFGVPILSALGSTTGNRVKGQPTGKPDPSRARAA